MELFDVTERALEVALHGTEMRQTVIANNLANVNTPNFKPSEVSFEPQLAAALQTARNGSDLSGVTPTVSANSGQSMRVDGSNIDVDREATALAETQLLFSSLMGVVTKNLHTMSQIIAGAR